MECGGLGRWLRGAVPQVPVAGAHLLDGRQAPEHARVPHAPQAGGGAPPPRAAHAADQPRVQAAAGL